MFLGRFWVFSSLEGRWIWVFGSLEGRWIWFGVKRRDVSVEVRDLFVDVFSSEKVGGIFYIRGGRAEFGSGVVRM